MDNSELNYKYFLDEDTFNCPFCGLRNTSYTILAAGVYDITNSKRAKIAFVQCNRCGKISLHFLKNDIRIFHYPSFPRVCREINDFYINSDNNRVVFYIPKYDDATHGDDEAIGTIDDYIFHSIPSTSFVLDERIPKVLRDLFNEADECRKANLKIGAAACLRKFIYTFLYKQLNEIKKCNPPKRIEEMGYKNYDECITEIKEAFPKLNTYFEILSQIKGITSDQIHEESWGEMSSEQLSLYLRVLETLMNEVYVQPAIQNERHRLISQQYEAIQLKMTKKKIK